MTGSPEGEQTRADDGEIIAGAPYPPPDSDLLAGILELGARAVSADRVSLWVVEPPADPGGRVPEEGHEGTGGRLLHRTHLYHPGAGAFSAGGLLPEDRFPEYFRALDRDDLLVVDDVTSDPRTAELVIPYARPLGIQGWIDQRVRTADGRTAVLRFERGGGFRRWTTREVRLARAVAAAIRTLPAVSDPSGADVGPKPRDRAPEHRYRRLLEHARVGMLRVDRDGIIRHCTGGFGELVGAGDPDDVTGRSLREFLAPESRESRILSRLRDLDALPFEEVRLDTGRDEQGWALLTAVRDPEGQGHLVLVLDVTARKEREQELRRQAHFDALTGLPNRRLLWQQASRLLALADRHGRTAAVAYLDICGFKEINDRYGHVAGDRVLEALGSRIESALRESDVGARIGGDEFAVLLSEVESESGALEACRRILRELSRPVTRGGDEVPVAVRAGIALYPDHGESLDDLLDRADQAMYVARSSRQKRRLAIYRPDSAPEAPRPDETTRNLQRAVEDDEFILHYQPIVSLPRGEFSGVEALIRWRHPRHGLLSPAAFLSDALQAGLLVEIDRWTLRRAIRQAAHWQRQGGPAWVSANLSRPSLRDPGLVHFLRGELGRTGLEPGRLVLELSEPDIRQEGEGALAAVADLRELGCRVALDCRETGPQVEDTLSRLDPELVKVDLETFRALDGVGERDDGNRKEPGGGDGGHEGGGLEALARRLRDILQDDGSRLLAERVETEEEFARVRGAAFALAQGYYMSRPAPAAEIRFPGGDGPEDDGSGSGGESEGAGRPPRGEARPLNGDGDHDTVDPSPGAGEGGADGTTGSLTALPRR